MPFVAVPPPPPPVPSVQLANGLAPSRSRETRPPPSAMTSDPSDFLVGSTEVRIRLGATGYGVGPLSLFGAFVGWSEVQASLDVGVAKIRRPTLSLGLELHYARPLILQSTTPVSVDGTPDGRVGWTAQDVGAITRTALHFPEFSAFDAYLVLLAGPTWGKVVVNYRGPDGTRASGGYSAFGARTGLGAGLSSVGDEGFCWGLELRYLVAFRLRYEELIGIDDADGSQILTFETGGRQRAPRGFSWVGFLGYRF